MIENLLSKLNSIPSDKVFHFAGGAIVFAATVAFIGAKYALALVIIVGVLKEIYDAMNKDKHTADIWDAIATALGGALGYFCTLY